MVEDVTTDALRYPTDRVVGIAPDRETLDAALTRLREAGVGDDDIEVLCSDTAAAKLDPARGATGPLERVARVAQRLLGEEAERLQTLSAAIEAGRYVVTVAVPDGEDEDAAKRSRGRALIDSGATQVAYYGELAIEELQLGS